MLSGGAHRLRRQLLLSVVVILELSDGRSPRNWLPTFSAGDNFWLRGESRGTRRAGPTAWALARAGLVESPPILESFNSSLIIRDPGDSVSTSNRLPAAERREQLLDVAMTVFAANGYHGTSMNDVAREAGVTKPVLYQHFASKRDLYIELVDDVASRLADEVVGAADAADTAVERTVNALTAYFSFVEENQREFQLLFGRSAPKDEDTANGSRMVESKMSATIAEILRRWLDVEEVEIYARAIVAMSEGVCRHWLTQVDRPSAEELAKQLAGLILTGLQGLIEVASETQNK